MTGGLVHDERNWDSSGIISIQGWCGSPVLNVPQIPLAVAAYVAATVQALCTAVSGACWGAVGTVVCCVGCVGKCVDCWLCLYMLWAIMHVMASAGAQAVLLALVQHDSLVLQSVVSSLPDPLV
jgi:hypothetical protein